MLLRLLACIPEHLPAARNSRCLVVASHSLTGTMLMALCAVPRVKCGVAPTCFFLRSCLPSVPVCLAWVSALLTATAKSSTLPQRFDCADSARLKSHQTPEATADPFLSTICLWISSTFSFALERQKSSLVLLRGGGTKKIRVVRRR